MSNEEFELDDQNVDTDDRHDSPPVQLEPLEESPVVEATPFEPRHAMPPRPSAPNRGPHKSSTQIAHEVWDGQWGDSGWGARVKAAGFDADMVQRLVDRGLGRPNENAVAPDFDE